MRCFALWESWVVPLFLLNLSRIGHPHPSPGELFHQLRRRYRWYKLWIINKLDDAQSDNNGVERQTIKSTYWNKSIKGLSDQRLIFPWPNTEVLDTGLTARQSAIPIKSDGIRESFNRTLINSVGCDNKMVKRSIPSLLPIKKIYSYWG